MTQDLTAVTGAPPGSTAALFFLPGQFIFRRFEQGREVTKALLSEQVARAFHEFSADTGWLGRRVLRTLMVPRDSCVVSCEPAGVRRVVCVFGNGETRELLIPLPPLVMLGRGREYFVYASKDAEPGPESRLFAAPCPNVGSGDGGRICFGSNQPPEASPEALEAVWELFWASAFNGDHSAQKSRSERKDVRNFWQKLHDRGAKRFPNSELLPLSANGRDFTVADAWRRLVREY